MCVYGGGGGGEEAYKKGEGGGGVQSHMNRIALVSLEEEEGKVRCIVYEVEEISGILHVKCNMYTIQHPQFETRRHTLMNDLIYMYVHQMLSNYFLENPVCNIYVI